MPRQHSQPTTSSANAADEKELQTLRTLRANLEAVRLLTAGIKSDVETLSKNYASVGTLAGRVEAVIQDTHTTTNAKP